MTAATAAVGPLEAAAHTDSDSDRRMMMAAIALGLRGLGTTAPNPSVGALVVRDGVIVGRGATVRGGRPHAETEALRNAGELARGATLYVSLEPCSHFGKTPPCAQAIINAGIARVVSALDDPDPRVAGRGHRMLRDAGIDVTTGVCSEIALQGNLGHILRVTLGRPMVQLKLAETADGQAAGDVHDGRLMITGQASNNRVQVMRAMADAIMTGIGTVRADDPLLTVRLPGLESHNPLRVVLDSRLSISIRSRLVSTAREVPLLIFCAADASAAAEEALAAKGVEVIRIATDAAGKIDISEALALLATRGITRVMSEGGPRVGSALISAGLADEVAIFTSPKPFGRAGTPVLSATARSMLSDRARFVAEERSQVGADLLRIWRRKL
jgi:diaminohydroxyphosphoribosylaminopyrimidine deaminase/5-amino-6-(5-phosphoribosylamino)uracil reductase